MKFYNSVSGSSTEQIQRRQQKRYPNSKKKYIKNLNEREGDRQRSSQQVKIAKPRNKTKKQKKKLKTAVEINKRNKF